MYPRSHIPRDPCFPLNAVSDVFPEVFSTNAFLKRSGYSSGSRTRLYCAIRPTLPVFYGSIRKSVHLMYSVMDIEYTIYDSVRFASPEVQCSAEAAANHHADVHF